MSLPHVWVTFTLPQKQAVTPLLQHLILILELEYLCLQHGYRRFSSSCFGLMFFRPTSSLQLSTSSAPNAANVLSHSLRSPQVNASQNVLLRRTSNLPQRANVAKTSGPNAALCNVFYRSRRLDYSLCKSMHCKCSMFKSSSVLSRTFGSRPFVGIRLVILFLRPLSQRKLGLKSYIHHSGIGIRLWLFLSPLFDFNGSVRVFIAAPEREQAAVPLLRVVIASLTAPCHNVQRSIKSYVHRLGHRNLSHVCQSVHLSSRILRPRLSLAPSVHVSYFVLAVLTVLGSLALKVNASSLSSSHRVTSSTEFILHYVLEEPVLVHTVLIARSCHTVFLYGSLNILFLVLYPLYCSIPLLLRRKRQFLSVTVSVAFSGSVLSCVCDQHSVVEICLGLLACIPAV